MNPYRNLIRWAGTKPWFAVLGRRVIAPLDKLLSSRRRALTVAAGTGLPVGNLTTTGRRSGQPRTVPLLHVPTPAGPAVVGTNFGATADPQWVANLRADSTASWTVGDHEVAVEAREATNDEYANLWAQLVEVWPGYEGYVSRSQRVPIMFILEPAE